VDGVLVVDKPSGMTSHDVVDEVRRVLGTRKVGHGGTLDPDATGVLVVGIGKATRLLSYAQAVPKRYLATVRFGITTTTQDASGEVLERREAVVTPEAVTVELRMFVGEIEQVPPMVSAVKIGGERLYRKARRGEDVERPARRVRVYAADLLSFREGTQPEADVDVRCSAGTYIRTLAHDLGERLGCGAHLVSLRRTEAGGFEPADACALTDVGPERILPMLDVVRALPQTEVDEDEAAAVANGRPLPAVNGSLDEGAATALLHGGRLLAVYRRKGGTLVAERVVPQ
jgi:tRNA pseudouridine55 synthase